MLLTSQMLQYYCMLAHIAIPIFAPEPTNTVIHYLHYSAMPKHTLGYSGRGYQLPSSYGSNHVHAKVVQHTPEEARHY